VPGLGGALIKMPGERLATELHAKDEFDTPGLEDGWLATVVESWCKEIAGARANRPYHDSLAVILITKEGGVVVAAAANALQDGM
jgi:hypothetical protein